MADKRKNPPTSAGNGAAVVKRQRQAGDRINGAGTALTIGGTASQQRAVIQAVKRTSGLQAPIMQLSGHTVILLWI
jgi:Prp8 binding protein